MTRNGMRSVADAVKMIEQGKALLLAGDEALLTQLPTGNWIAGTTVSFMTEDGGMTDREHLFVTDLSDFADRAIVKRYKIGEIPHIANDYSASGFTVLIVPSGSDILASFAKKSNFMMVCSTAHCSAGLPVWTSPRPRRVVPRFSPEHQSL